MVMPFVGSIMTSGCGEGGTGDVLDPATSHRMTGGVAVCRDESVTQAKEMSVATVATNRIFMKERIGGSWCGKVLLPNGQVEAIQAHEAARSIGARKGSRYEVK